MAQSVIDLIPAKIAVQATLCAMHYAQCHSLNRPYALCSMRLAPCLKPLSFLEIGLDL